MVGSILTQWRSFSVGDLGRLAALFALSCIVVWLSLEFTREAGRVASIWPLNALLVASVVRWRAIDWRILLAVGAAANLSVDLFRDDTLFRAMMLTSANVVEVTIVVSLLRLHRAAFDIAQGVQLLRFFAVAGAVAPAASSVIAALTLLPQDFSQTFGLWFAADALGLLIFVPAIMALQSSLDAPWTPARRTELVLNLAALGVVSVFVFSQNQYPLLFLVPPALAVATFRLGIAGAGAGLLIVAAFAIGFAMIGHGPTQLIEGGETEQVLVLQAFLAIMSLSTLPIAAALAHGTRAKEGLTQAVDAALAAKARAEQSEANYRLLADYSTDIVVRLGPGGVIAYASPACRILGISPEQAIGRSTVDFVAPEDRAFAIEVIDELFAGPEPDRSIRREFRVPRADGSVLWLEGNPSIIRDDQGRPIEVVTTYRDITARRQLELDLLAARGASEAAAAQAAESEARFRTISDISLDIHRARGPGRDYSLRQPQYGRRVGVCARRTGGHTHH